MHFLEKFIHKIFINQQEEGNLKKKQNTTKTTLQGGQWIRLRFLNDCYASQTEVYVFSFSF